MFRTAACVFLALLAPGVCSVGAEVEAAGPNSAGVAGPIENEASASAEFSRALLAETNRARRENLRRPLKPRAELDAAADDQAAFMALRCHVQHGSFLPGQATPADRVRRHGLEGLAVSENVASAIVGGSSTAMSVREIAAMLVEQWMNSPGHRANLLDARFTHFGGSVRLSRLPTGQWVAYGAQVFLIARPPFGRLST